jgi:multicomponent Na+:H+ antiporter subunit D
MELVAISSVALVAFGCESEELEAAFKYLILGTVASFLILFSIALIYSITGSLNMAQIAVILRDMKRTPAIGLSFALFLAGFAIKAALPPFHTWLPDAHPAAPAPVSAMLSSVVVKAAGIYVLCRLIFNVFGITPLFSETLMFLGMFSIILGAVMAMGQWDLKRLLAYSTISQVGYIVFGIGLATPLGVLGGLFHLLNHSMMKSLLFLNSGSVQYRTGERDMRRLGGLKGKMPVTYITFLIASMSVAGVPPLGGFFSKLIIIIAAVISRRYVYAFTALLVSIVTLAYMLRAQKLVFQGETKPELSDVVEAPRSMLVPMIILSLMVVSAGLLFPYVLAYIINPAMRALMEGVPTYSGFIIGG